MCGGYKKYRNNVINYLNKIGSKLKVILISGKTGSAKTKILQNIVSHGGQILDLEHLASHKGSLLGKIPGFEQSSPGLNLCNKRISVKCVDILCF